MSRGTSFPVFDLARFEAGSSDEMRALGAEVDAICRATGFLAVAGHGVPDATVEAAWTKAEAFFALPPERKQSAKAPYPGYPYGYLGPETESLARSRGVEAPPDMKESFQRRSGAPARRPRRSRGARLLLRADHLAGRSGWFPRRLARLLRGDGGPRGAHHARFRRRAAFARGLLRPVPLCAGERAEGAQLSRARRAAEAGPDSRRRAYRLRQPDHPAAAGRLAGA